MRCPKCRTLILFPAGATWATGSLMRCPRCPAIWIARAEEAGVIHSGMPPSVTRREPIIIEGQAVPPGAAARRPRASGAPMARVELRRYGIAAGAAVLMMALVAVVLLAPDVSALPGIALLDGAR